MLMLYDFGGMFLGVGTWGYIFLIIIGFLALLISFWKIRSIYLLVFYFAACGLTYFFDYFVYVWGKGYKYHPGFIKGGFDTHLGAMVNGHILAAFAVLYVALRCRPYWSVVLAGTFSGIELLFAHWGSFTSNWWNPWITFFTLIFYFPACRMWWHMIINRHGKWGSFVNILCAFYAIFILLSVVLYGILKLRTFHVDWIEKLHRNASAINSFTALVFGSLLAILMVRKARMIWYFMLLLLFVMYDFGLKYADIVTSRHVVWDSFLSLLTFLNTAEFSIFNSQMADF